SHDAASRMCCRSAHPEISYGRRVSRPAGNGTQEKQLIESEFAVKDVAFRQRKVMLQVERRQNLTVQNDLAHVRRVLRQRIDDRITESFALPPPRSLRKRVRRVLHETREDVLARRRH